MEYLPWTNFTEIRSNFYDKLYCVLTNENPKEYLDYLFGVLFFFERCTTAWEINTGSLEGVLFPPADLFFPNLYNQREQSLEGQSFTSMGWKHVQSKHFALIALKGDTLLPACKSFTTC